MTEPTTQTKAKEKPAPKATSDDLLGITVNDCPVACSAERCVISRHPHCAHPRKGGLQGAQMGDVKAIGRLNDAKKRLAHLAVDNRS